LHNDNFGPSCFILLFTLSHQIKNPNSDLDVYFEDGCYMCAPEDNKKFNIFDWWKNHELKYRILSKLARDILAIPITTVASKATFSAGSKVIDQYRAKLGVDTMQALLCGEN
ncbi:zinc finger BED domain-containing protein RICESLEEPER 2-like protein, partial [Tanacetum coccineum]